MANQTREIKENQQKSRPYILAEKLHNTGQTWKKLCQPKSHVLTAVHRRLGEYCSSLEKEKWELLKYIISVLKIHFAIT